MRNSIEYSVTRIALQSAVYIAKVNAYLWINAPFKNFGMHSMTNIIYIVEHTKWYENEIGIELKIYQKYIDRPLEDVC